MSNHVFLESYFRMLAIFEPSWPKKTGESPSDSRRDPGKGNGQKSGDARQVKEEKAENDSEAREHGDKALKAA